MLDIGKQIEEVNEEILKLDIPRYLQQEQARGFPTKSDQYQLFLKNRGSTSRRQLATVRARYLRIPWTMTFIAMGTLEDALEAFRMAYFEARARAPVRSGRYQGSISSSSGTKVTGQPPTSARGLDPDTIFRVAATADYSSIIEAGFFKGYYKTQSLPKGILYFVTQRVRAAFGNRISIRFRYIGGGRLGTIPVIEIARAGLFAGADTKPGTGKSRRRRRGRRRR